MEIVKYFVDKLGKDTFDQWMGGYILSSDVYNRFKTIQFCCKEAGSGGHLDIIKYFVSKLPSVFLFFLLLDLTLSYYNQFPNVIDGK